MTTKKIQSGEELSSLLRSLNGNVSRKKKSDAASDYFEAAASEEKVNLDLSKSIHSQLDPEKMAAERKEKIEKLKELIKAGKYNPKSEDIATALQQDIVFEILSSKSDGAVNE